MKLQLPLVPWTASCSVKTSYDWVKLRKQFILFYLRLLWSLAQAES
jgi:hypothetical protein